MLHPSTTPTGYLYGHAYPHHLHPGQLFIAALVCSNLNAKRRGGDDKGQKQRQMNTKYKSICKTQVGRTIAHERQPESRGRGRGRGGETIYLMSSDEIGWDLQEY